MNVALSSRVANPKSNRRASFGKASGYLPGHAWRHVLSRHALLHASVAHKHTHTQNTLDCSDGLTNRSSVAPGMRRLSDWALITGGVQSEGGEVDGGSII